MEDGIIVAGNMIVDVLKMIDSYPSKMSLTSISSISHSIGGAVCNCGIDLAKMDPELPVTALGAVGDDEFGRKILESLSGHPNIDTSHVVHVGETSFTDVMTESETGQRTFFTYKGADSSLGPEDFPLDRVSGGLFHIGYIMLLDGLDEPDPDYGTAMARLLAMAQERGFRTSVDIVTEAGDRYANLVPPSLRYTDYCCINETEAEMVTGIALADASGGPLRKNFPSACRKLKEMGVSSWAVIHTPDYSGGLDEEDRYFDMESMELPRGYIKGSVGAGDAFAAGVLYSAYRLKGLDEAIRLGSTVAVCSLSQPGATEGVMSIPEMEKAMAVLESGGMPG